MRYFKAGMLLILVGYAGVCTAQQTVKRFCEVDANVSVYVENTSGSVTVEGWDKLELELEADLGSGVQRLDFDSSKDKVVVEVVVPDRKRSDIATHIRIRMPRSGSLDVETVSARVKSQEVGGDVEIGTISGGVEVSGNCESLEIETVSGSVETESDTKQLKIETVSAGIRNKGSAESISLETVSGKISHVGLAGRVKAHTISGGIEVQGLIDEFDGESVSGKIEASGIQKKAKLSSVSSSVSLDAGAPEDVSLETISGSVRYSGSLADNGEFDAETRSGSVSLTVPEDLNATYTFESFNGSIRNDWGPRPEKPKYGPGVSLRFSVGFGNADIDVETFSGSIALRKK